MSSPIDAVLGIPLKLFVAALLVVMMIIVIGTLNYATSMTATYEKYTEEKLNTTGIFSSTVLAMGKVMENLLPILPVLVFLAILAYKKKI